MQIQKKIFGISCFKWYFLLYWDSSLNTLAAMSWNLAWRQGYTSQNQFQFFQTTSDKYWFQCFQELLILILSDNFLSLIYFWLENYLDNQIYCQKSHAGKTGSYSCQLSANATRPGQMCSSTLTQTIREGVPHFSIYLHSNSLNKAMVQVILLACPICTMVLSVLSSDLFTFKILIKKVFLFQIKY